MNEELRRTNKYPFIIACLLVISVEKAHDPGW